VATIDELPLHYRVWMRAYPWRVLDPVPWTSLRKPMPECRIGLVTSAGLFRREHDPPFVESLRGDPTVRWLDTDTPPEGLVLGQTSDAFDRGPLQRDIGGAWPVDALREAVGAGRIGSLNRYGASFNGSMSAPGRFLRDTAPAVADRFRKEDVDAVLLVPV
jgi:D-proline reductase (dithiol) PrdB